MNTVQYLLLLACALITAGAAFIRHTRTLIGVLAVQSMLLGIEELVVSFLHFQESLFFESIIEFFLSMFELSLGALVAPLIIYAGMKRTENIRDKPFINSHAWMVLVFSLVVVAFLAFGMVATQLPGQLEMLPCLILILVVAAIGTMTRRDPLKIIVGLNMAENALLPLSASPTVIITPFLLGMIIFIDALFIFITIEGYHEHGALDILRWRSSF